MAALATTVLAVLLLVLATSCETAQRAAVATMLETHDTPALYRLPPEGGVVYLTIDDGPSPLTAEMLEILKEHDAAATFFIHTDHVENEEILTRMIKEGHNLGHHMPSDRNWAAEPPERFGPAFMVSHCYLAGFGEGYSGRFRPPHGRFDEEAMTPALHGAGLGSGRPFVLATFLPWDAGGLTETSWARGNRLVARRYGEGLGTNVGPGDIVVFHDGPRSMRTASTLVSLERFLDILEARGLEARALPALRYRTEACPDPAGLNGTF